MPAEELAVCRHSIVRAEKTFADASAPEHQARDRDFHVNHIRLDLRPDLKAKRIRGTSTLTLAPINDGLRRIDLDAVDLTIRGVKGEGRDLKFDHRDGTLTVTLPRAYKAGKEFTLAVRYDGRPQKGLFFVGPDKDYKKKPEQLWTQGEAEDNKFWFPCYEAPNDRMTSEVRITVPRDWTAVSNGRLLSVDERAGGRTFHWRQDVPHVNYLIALTAGKYDLKEEQWNGVPLQYYVPEGLGRFIPLAFKETRSMMDFFSDVTGVSYPYPKYAQVVVSDFTFGGMENTSMTTLTDLALHEESARPNFRTESLLAHELAHQWFGDYVTMKAWPHLWLNEGFATYFDPLWHEHRYGKDEFQQIMMLEAAGYFEEDGKSYRRSIVTTKFHGPEDMFDAHTYNKGALVLHMLRYVLGDKLWWKAIRHYVKKHGMQVVETNDLKLAIEESTGKALDWFFNQWVYKGGHPDYEVSWSYDDAAKLAAVTVKQKQEVKDLTPLFRMPIEILVANGGTSRTEKVEVRQKEETFYIPAKTKPEMVVFDPENWVLKKLTFEKGKEEFLHQVATGPTIASRIQACQGLGKILHDEKVVAALRKALTGDTFWGVRVAAARALGEIGTDEAKGVLLKQGVRQKDARARRAVADALGKFREDDDAFEALVGLYTKDPKVYVAASAASAIARTRHPKAFDAIRKGMDRESHAGAITRFAITGLASLRDEKAIPVIKPYAKRGRTNPVRVAAIDALGRLGDQLETHRQDIREFLVPLLRDVEMRIRNATCASLATLGDTAAIPEMQKLEENDIMGMTRRAARRSIRRIRDKKAETAKKAEFSNDLEKLKDENLKMKRQLAKLESELKGMKRSGSKRR